MANDSDLEKTETASGSRIQKAYEDGDVPRSKELSTAATLIVAGACLWGMGGFLEDALKSLMISGMKFDSKVAMDPVSAMSKIYEQIGDLVIVFIPIFTFILLAEILSPIGIGGWNMSTKMLAPNIQKLNPITGFGNIFNKNSWVELLKSICKVGLIAIISYLAISYSLPDLMKLPLLPIETGLSNTVNFLIVTFFLILIGYLVIVAIDVPYQLHRYAEKLKMSVQEVREEMRDSNGSPEIKAKIRQQQIAMSRRRMMSQIQNADVVITNPTHYAVAVKYDSEVMGAPRILAKGSDAVALRIREIANEHQILMVESPKLARALYAHTEVEQEIPEALYLAVAEILAYVFQVKSFNGRDGEYPTMPQSIEVPDELDPHITDPRLTLDINSRTALTQ
ncbi:flagellar biosynthesis protein FlhB [Polynucleobacter sp. UK-Mo-2m-Kol15]|uniref:flagellar biosynthesis protein FlhB n=1 Tax=Polynucleobacter sp. UK-Mo-2m-Kol15 TaxID=2576916 RepID=UPI001C0C03BD|nr:flagellar biosynthesis protein FlhB [Polynucleobacter sp. UK-Mo-2m-Kol15]